MTESFLKEAKTEDVPSIVSLLLDMQEELKELELNPDIVTKSISDALNENVFWFLFIDEDNKIFGTCYLQSVHNYWSAGKRYYLGGFFIAPTHRRHGRFRTVNKLLKEWVESHGGVQIYAHIHKDNQKSLQTFEAVNMQATEYYLCANHWGD